MSVRRNSEQRSKAVFEGELLHLYGDRGGEEIASQFHMGCIPVEKNGKKYKYCYSLVESAKDIPIMYHDIVQWGTAAMKENCKKAMEIFAMRK